MEELERGVTGMDCTGTDGKMLYCVVSPKELPVIVKLIKSINNGAFIINDARVLRYNPYMTMFRWVLINKMEEMIMKKRISVLLCAAMLLTLLAGCGGGDNLTGTWEANIDVAETIGTGIMDEIAKSMPELKEYIDLSGLSLVIRTTFNEDGTFVSTVTEESFNAMMNDAAKKAADGFTNYINKIVTDLKLNIDINTVIGLNDGESVEDRLKSQFNAEDFKQIIEDNAQSGVYRAKDGKLFTAETEDGFTDEKFETYVLNADTLELTGSEGMEEDVTSLMTKKYPITYKKIG